jgi:hypothetical protein
MISILEEIQNQRNNPDLENTLNIQHLLTQSSETHYLKDKTIGSVSEEIRENIRAVFINTIETEIHELVGKLSDFRWVENVCDLHKGVQVRWIRLSQDSPKLTNGGIVVDVKFTDSGVQVLCKSKNNRFIQYKMDECLTFQKLNEDELMILHLSS